MILKPVRPLKINRIPENRLEIKWHDGHITYHSFHRLRFLCACAQCRDEMTGQRLIKPGDIPMDIELHAIHPMGNYALRFVWSDGHQTGLYSFDYLRENNEPDEPVGNRREDPPPEA